MNSSYMIEKGLYLEIREVKSTEAKPVEGNVHHMLIVDCSGSMCGELEQVRAHIKAQVPKLMREGDTLSLIAFSGRGQFWRVLTAEPVASLKDLTTVNAAVDRWLRPVGMTGFKEPIEEATVMMGEISKKSKDPFSVMFLTDGYENQWPKHEVLSAIDKMGGQLAAATVVSYGNYADLQFLAKMAERWGGTLVQSENFLRFKPVLEAVVQKRIVGGKRIKVDIQSDVIGGVAFAIDGDEVVTFALEGNAVRVPPSVRQVAFLAPSGSGSHGPLTASFSASLASDLPGPASHVAPSTYAAISVFATRMRPDIVLPLLAATGDVAFIERFSTLFGRQKYADFQTDTAKAASDPRARWTSGFDQSAVPRDDAFSIMELVDLLTSDEDNRLMLNDPAFVYNRIGRARMDANTRFTVKEQEELEALNEELSKVKKNAVKAKEISAKIAALTNKPEPLKFEEIPPFDGYDVDGVVWSEDRANLSLRVTKRGTVDLSSRLPIGGDRLGAVPSTFSTFTFRNYAIIKDGIVNVDRLPVRLSRETSEKLDAIIESGRAAWKWTHANVNLDGSTTRILDLKALPIINRQMVKTMSAKELFEAHWGLTKAQAAQKVANAFLKEFFPGKKSDAFEALYGADATKWLAEQGITDYSGFNPRSLAGDPTDVYMAKEFAVKLAGYSTIPSLADWRKQRDKGKFNGPGALMSPFVEQADKIKNDEKALREMAKKATAECRKWLHKIATIKFASIVGQTWFKEFPSLEESTMDLTLDGLKLSFTAALREVEEKI